MRALAATLVLTLTLGSGCATTRSTTRSAYQRPMVKAGIALTAIGSAISIAGTILYFSTSGDPHTTGLILAPSAEPLMITGTVLWVVGLIRAPHDEK
ncbi:MAG TPA: hypothetical protein VII38_07760 [Polyangia bacterium]